MVTIHLEKYQGSGFEQPINDSTVSDHHYVFIIVFECPIYVPNLD